jgi:hypothetical protein
VTQLTVKQRDFKGKSFAYSECISSFNEMIAVLIKDELIGQKFSRKELERRVQSLTSEV